MDEKRAIDRVIHVVAIVGPLLFVAIATVEGFLRTGYDPISQPISALALGPRGWIQELNFVLLAASFLSFALMLRKTLSGGVGAVAGPGVLLLMTVGVTLAGLFPLDAPGAPPTLAG